MLRSRMVGKEDRSLLKMLLPWKSQSRKQYHEQFWKCYADPYSMGYSSGSKELSVLGMHMGPDDLFAREG